ncbi:hypothetical protein [Streptomyces chryseus]|uniref:Integral membrane protein n=1 Tax=Streptomyces chryseus TaxID=68186 RepID=A0ABQ3EDD4_9ACTN|nr:hypothetical protein [Streptomyces chryseus]GHB32714.1 hypothetical protein GCM10010346_64960 [Streptomyces chryseus]
MPRYVRVKVVTPEMEAAERRAARRLAVIMLPSLVLIGAFLFGWALQIFGWARGDVALAGQGTLLLAISTVLLPFLDKWWTGRRYQLWRPIVGFGGPTVLTLVLVYALPAMKG